MESGDSPFDSTPRSWWSTSRRSRSQLGRDSSGASTPSGSRTTGSLMDHDASRGSRSRRAERRATSRAPPANRRTPGVRVSMPRGWDSWVTSDRRTPNAARSGRGRPHPIEATPDERGLVAGHPGSKPAVVGVVDADTDFAGAIGIDQVETARSRGAKLSESTKPSGVISTGSCAMSRETSTSTKRFFSRALRLRPGAGRSRTRCGPDFSV